MKKFAFIVALVVLSACTTIKQNNGAEIRQVKLDQITPESTKGDVFRLLGSPSTKSVYGQETWYYITSKLEKQLVRDDKILNQSIIAITFNEIDGVDNIEFYNTDDRREFATSKKVTPTAGKSLSVIEQILGNVGKFNTDDPNAAIGSRSPGGGQRP